MRYNIRTERNGTERKSVKISDTPQVSCTRILLPGYQPAPSPAVWNLITPNTLSFPVPPAKGSVVSATYTWYYRVRFGEDVQDYNNFMYQLWELKKLSLEMVKP
jgi:hypothetical protein